MLKTSFAKLKSKDQKLISEAEKVLKNSYDPYSQFYVGAALLTEKGNIYFFGSLSN